MTWNSTIFKAAGLIVLFGTLQACGEQTLDLIPSDELPQSSAPSAPKSIIVSSPEQAVSNIDRPTLKITGVKSGLYVDIFDSSSCKNPIKSVKATNTSVSVKLSSLADGKYKFFARARNKAGKSSCRGTALYTVDTIAPSQPIITSPTNGSYVDTSITLAGTCESGSNLTIAGDITPSTVNISCSNGTFSQLLNLVTGSGIKNISIFAKDAAENQSSTASVSYVQDNDAPTATIDSLNSINSANESNYSLSGTCDDNNATITLTNPSAVNGQTASCSSGTFSFSNLDVSSIPDGSINFQISIQDPAGNSSTASASTSKDATAPVISSLALSSPSSPGNDTTPEFTITGTFPSGDSFQLFSDATCTTSISSVVVASSANTVLVASNAIASNTTHVYYAKGFDDAGNLACSGAGISASYALDTVAPTVTINALSTITVSNQTNYTLSGTCSANGDVINIQSPAIAGTRTCAAGVYSFTGLNVSSLSQGNNTFTVRASDTAGNQTTASRVVVKDTVAPTTPACAYFDGNATPTKSDNLTWTGSTDATSGISHYEMAVGKDSTGDIVGWTNIGASVSPYQFRGISPKLVFDQDYVTYIRAVDNVGLVSSEASCGPWKVSPGYGNFRGTQVDDKVNPDIINQADPYHLVFSEEHGNTAYVSSSRDSIEMKMNESGNYLLSLNLPLERLNGNSNKSAGSAKAIVKVNGGIVTTAYSANSFTRGYTGEDNAVHGSNHMTILLKDLNEGDTVTVETQNNADANEPLVVSRNSMFSVYMEYIHENEVVLSARSTSTENGPNFNDRHGTKLLWNKDITNSEYSHSDGESEIKLGKGGDYLISVNIPMHGSDRDQKVEARILVNGSEINNSVPMVASNSFILYNYDHFNSSASFVSVLYKLNPSDIISIETRQSGSSGDVDLPPKTEASLYIQKINTSEKYFISNGKSPGNWTDPSVIEWQEDYVNDPIYYAHNNGENEVSIQEDGDYVAYVINYLVSDTDFAKPLTRLQINGKPYQGSECSTNDPITGFANAEYSSCAMQILLQDMKKGDAITYTTELDILSARISGESPRIVLKKISRPLR